ncbi:MAG: hypothetical protein FVQ81_01625 [Candidatus Glassbacteria bacterium]|nr:hypothetical protein [Candidatus Glassbacteria bacterium]
MAEKRQKDISEEDGPGEDRLDDSEEDKLEGGGAEDAAASVSDPVSQAASDSAGKESADWFVDFDVWEAALEAKFGPKFEQVLTGELGADWVNKLNSKMMNERNFYNVLDDVKDGITGQTQAGHPQIVERGDSDLPDDWVGFEALGPGEVIYDERMVGPAGPGGGGGGGGGGGRSLPNLSDIRKKEFDQAGELKAAKEAFSDFDMIDGDSTLPDEEVVLMDRNDFSRLSYFARKELDRHKDDLDTSKVLERKSEKKEQQKIGAANKLILLLASLVLLYTIFTLAALPFGEYYENKIAADNPADYLFRPSTALYKQGELSRTTGGAAISFYFLQPAMNRLELNHIIGGDERRFELELYNGKSLEIADGPWGGAMEVHRFYSQNWPTNRSAFLQSPYLSLSSNGTPLLLAFERSVSGILPGLLVMDVVTDDGRHVAVAYVADNLLNIRLVDPVQQGSAEEAGLTIQFLFLFSLLEL